MRKLYPSRYVVNDIRRSLFGDQVAHGEHVVDTAYLY